MRRGGFKREVGAPELHLLTRLTLLPMAERLFVALLVVLSVSVPVLVLYGESVDPQAASPWGWAARHPLSLWCLALLVAAAALACLEPPRAASPRAWLQQLRARAHRTRALYAANLKRHHPEEQHAFDEDSP